MASTNLMGVSAASTGRERELVTGRLGLLNGLLIGVAVVAGAWALDALRLLRSPVRLQLPALAVGAALIVAVCALAGRLSVHREKGWEIVFTWLAASTVSALVIAYQPSYIRTVMVWLVDRRFWGRMIYAPPAGLTPIIALIAGFFLLLSLLLLAMLQNYRLESIAQEVGLRRRLPPAAWMMLLLPLPLVAGAGYLTGEINGDPTAAAIEHVYRAIEVVRGYDGDLFARGLEDGVNYGALRGVRDHLDGPYTLTVGDVDTALSTSLVIAQFENGAWIGCRVINEQLTFCEDVARPYTEGLAQLIAGRAGDPACAGCQPETTGRWLTWLREREPRLGPNPRFTRLAQWGDHVLMEARATDSGDGVTCWFTGYRPVVLESCSEVNLPGT